MPGREGDGNATVAAASGKHTHCLDASPTQWGWFLQSQAVIDFTDFRAVQARDSRGARLERRGDCKWAHSAWTRMNLTQKLTCANRLRFGRPSLPRTQVTALGHKRTTNSIRPLGLFGVAHSHAMSRPMVSVQGGGQVRRVLDGAMPPQQQRPLGPASRSNIVKTA